MIDLHCHVLPAVDDGPATPQDALALARGAREDGIATIVATPHVDAKHPHVGAALVRAGVRDLQQRLDVAGIDVRILPGAEVAATQAAELDDEQLRALTLGGSPWLLLECPLEGSPVPWFLGIARTLARRGHRLLLAHPERSPLFLRTPELLDALVDDGMLVQVTAAALTARYGRGVRELALRLVRRELVHVVASDGHGRHRPARIGAELRQAGIAPPLADWLARAAPAALLAGEPLPPRPPLAPRPRRRGVLRLVGR